MSKRSRDQHEAPARAAIAFDIDGVFKYGREWSKDGHKALQRVIDENIPFCFITTAAAGSRRRVRWLNDKQDRGRLQGSRPSSSAPSA